MGVTTRRAAATAKPAAPSSSSSSGGGGGDDRSDRAGNPAAPTSRPRKRSAVGHDNDSDGEPDNEPSHVAVNGTADKAAVHHDDGDGGGGDDDDDAWLAETRRGVEQVMRDMHTDRGFLHRALYKHHPPWYIAVALALPVLPLLAIVGLVVLTWRTLMRVECLARYCSSFIPVAMHETFNVLPELESITLQEFLTRHGPPSDGIAAAHAKPVETAGMEWDYPWRPDVRVYWFGKRRACSAGPQSEHFDPRRPTIMYLHGWQPGVTERGFRETINFVNPPGQTSPLRDTQVVDLWVARGYNVGVFYWNQLADEPSVAEAERKIYNATDGARLRWRRRNEDGSTIFVDRAGLFRDDHCVADVFVKAYLAHFPAAADADYGPVQLLGHSLGSQLVLESLRRLLLGQTSYYGTAAAAPIWFPQRLSLVDPFFTSGKKSFGPLDGLRTSQRAAENINILREALPSLLIETYESSLIGAGGLGEACPRLKRHSVYHVVDIQQIPWLDISLRHCASPFVYFCSILRDEATAWRHDSFNAAVPYEIMMEKMPPHATHSGPLHDHLRPDQALVASASLLLAHQ